MATILVLMTIVIFELALSSQVAGEKERRQEDTKTLFIAKIGVLDGQVPCIKCVSPQLAGGYDHVASCSQRVEEISNIGAHKNFNHQWKRCCKSKNTNENRKQMKNTDENKPKRSNSSSQGSSTLGAKDVQQFLLSATQTDISLAITLCAVFVLCVRSNLTRKVVTWMRFFSRKDQVQDDQSDHLYERPGKPSSADAPMKRRDQTPCAECDVRLCDTVVLPCSHLTMCGSCVSKKGACPRCQATIRATCRVFVE